MFEGEERGRREMLRSIQVEKRERERENRGWRETNNRDGKRGEVGMEKECVCISYTLLT